MMHLPKDYMKDILVRLAHHSSAIEGNTITLAETASIILHNTINSNRSIDLREVWEVKNHEKAFEYVIECAESNDGIYLNTVKEIHNLLTDRLLLDKGQFKQNDNAIIGADFDTALAKDTPSLMYQWVNNLNYRLENASSTKDKIDIISESHIEFERIHPFSDGNGRTGRMLINHSLLQNDLPPLVIEFKDKAQYIGFLANQDHKGLSDFMSKALVNEAERIKKFQDMEKQQIKPENENGLER